MHALTETANYPAGMDQQHHERNLTVLTAISMVVQVTLFGVASIGIGEINGVKVEEARFICVSQALMQCIFEMPEL